MSTILQRLEASGYNPSAQELEEFLTLAKNNGTVTGAVEGGYWRILLNLSILEGSVYNAHQKLYPEVKRVCITEGMTAQERNKATNFARSAYSTLRRASDRGMVLEAPLTKKDATDWIKANSKVPSMSSPHPTATYDALELLDKIYNLTTYGADKGVIIDRFNTYFGDK